MVTLFLVLNALTTQAATIPASPAIMLLALLTCGLHDRSAETITPKSLTFFVG